MNGNRAKPSTSSLSLEPFSNRVLIHVPYLPNTQQLSSLSLSLEHGSLQRWGKSKISQTKKPFSQNLLFEAKPYATEAMMKRAMNPAMTPTSWRILYGRACDGILVASAMFSFFACFSNWSNDCYVEKVRVLQM